MPVPRTRALALPLLVVLAGCASGPENAGIPQSGPILVTDPSDYTYLNGTTNESNEHLHDYWNGQTRLGVIDDAVTTNRAGSSADPVASFRPPPGPGVPQGAARVEVTVDWTAQPGSHHGAPELWIKTAADRDAKRIGPATPRTAIPFETTNAQNDLPHQRLSAWEFQVVFKPQAPNPFFFFHGTIRLKAEAIRGLDIPLYPGHPDAWKGRTESELLRVEGSSPWQIELAGANLCGGSCVGTAHRPADGRIVPWDAAVVRATLTHAGTQPLRLKLLYHPADAREFRTASGQESGQTRTYEILVGTGGDGAYAQQSSWEFLLSIDQNSPARAWSGGYTLTATVHKRA